MIRKVFLILLIGILCLSGVFPALAQKEKVCLKNVKIYPTLSAYERLTRKRIARFNEAPMLADLVKEGKLPSIEKRLPKEPVVIEPRNEIGRYGGTLRGASIGPNTTGDLFYSNMQYLFRLAPDFETIVPNIAKDWKLSSDMKSLTIYLREGMKWSDGVPFTTDDVRFWYEDVFLNDKLTPVKPTMFKDLVKLEIADDYTFTFHFSISNPHIIDVLAQWNGYYGFPIPPKHYVKQFHIKYNPDADSLSKKMGYDNWWQAFGTLTDNGNGQVNPDLPVLHPWKLEKIDSYNNKYYIRNPYYWKIDTVGNQLPYIDRLFVKRVENIEIKNMLVVNGEVDISGIWQKLVDYTFFKTNEQKGNYRAMLWPDYRGIMDYAFGFNLTHKDPILRKIFNDIRFRRAMSLAINREEMNEALFLGLGKPSQATVPPLCSFYEKWQEEYYMQYDPKAANRLLDSMGLKWDKDHKCRLRPDGQVLAITLEGIERYMPGLEMVKKYWEAVGIKVALKEQTEPFLAVRKEANEVDVGIWATDFGPDYVLRKTAMSGLLPTFGVGVCYPWKLWYDSGGKSGEEPPETVKKLYKLTEDWKKTIPGSTEYIKLGKEIVSTFVRNLYVIGTVGIVPYPVIISNRLVNTPSKPGEDAIWLPAWLQWQPYLQEQWFFKE